MTLRINVYMYMYCPYLFILYLVHVVMHYLVSVGTGINELDFSSFTENLSYFLNLPHVHSFLCNSLLLYYFRVSKLQIWFIIVFNKFPVVCI